MALYLAKGETTKLRRRLEADVRSLYALYEYGRLHAGVVLGWGSVEEMLPAPWSHPDEGRLYKMMDSALAMGVPLEVVLGSAPDLEDPWSRARSVFVRKVEGQWRPVLVEEDGRIVDEWDVQRARVAEVLH